MSEPESTRHRAEVFLSGASRAIRLPDEFRFDSQSVWVRQQGRDLILSPQFASTADYWEHGALPADDYTNAVLKRKSKQATFEQRVNFN